MIRSLLNQYGVPYVADGHHSHNTAGWVNVHCPFCRGTPNFHLGFLENGTGANCWRCGSHPTVTALSAVLGISEAQVRRALKSQPRHGVRKKRTEPKIEVRAFKYPKPTFDLLETGKRYLEKRKFDPDKLVAEWGLLQTGPISLLDKIQYGNRIVIPIEWDGLVVSFQARDITGRHSAKYLACSKGRERIHHKHVVYGKQSYGEAKIIAEGPADVWRLGKDALGTMGIKFTMEQVLQLSNLADRFFVLFDSERQAQEQAKRLAAKLRGLGKRAKVFQLPRGDPGEMSQDDANHLVRELLGGRRK